MKIATTLHWFSTLRRLTKGTKKGFAFYLDYWIGMQERDSPKGEDDK